MKNVKYLGFVGLGCAALLLTGCGGGHTLTCTKQEDGQTEEVVYEFNDKEDKVTGAKMYMTVDIPEDTSDEEIEQAKSLLESMFCSSTTLKDCKTSVKGNKFEFEASVDPEGLDDEDFKGTKAELKANLEEDGYTCK